MSIASAASPGFSHRVLILEDDDFTRTMLSEGLAASGFTVESASSVSQATELLAHFEPNAVIVDLNLGAGPNGSDFLIRVDRDFPWVGQVALSSHASPELATGISGSLPKSTIYLVKSQLQSIAVLKEAIEQSIASADYIKQEVPLSSEGTVTLTPNQAEILWLMAQGLSNAGIAERRNTTLRAAEALVQRTVHALGIESDSLTNSRVVAVSMWHQGKIVVR
mgnify:CR=1 FL=1